MECCYNKINFLLEIGKLNFLDSSAEIQPIYSNISYICVLHFIREKGCAVPYIQVLYLRALAQDFNISQFREVEIPLLLKAIN